MKTVKGLLIALAVCLVCSIILFKCNNPVKTWWEHKKIQHAANKAGKQAQIEAGNILHPDSTEYYKNAYDQEVATNTVVVAKLGTLNEIYPHKVDSIARRFGLREKQLREIMNMQGSVHSHVVSTIDPIYEDADNGSDDSSVHDLKLVGYGFPIDDSFIVGEGVIDTSITKITLNYNAYFDLNLAVGVIHPLNIWFLKFKNFPFAKKKIITKAYSDNPKVHIGKLSVIQLSQ